MFEQGNPFLVARLARLFWAYGGALHACNGALHAYDGFFRPATPRCMHTAAGGMRATARCTRMQIFLPVQRLVASVQRLVARVQRSIARLQRLFWPYNASSQAYNGPLHACNADRRRATP